MKSMTCKQLGGACDEVFEAENFEEMARKSQRHAQEMLIQGDEAHRKAMQEMRVLMRDQVAMQRWMDEKRREFEELPDSD